MKWRKMTCVMVLFMAPAAFAQLSSRDSFEKLKSLAGTWEGKMSNGQAVRESYRVTANGSAVMSEIEGEHNMVTMFHLDGDRLLMTHYCGAGNQPRMKAVPVADGNSVAFDFLDATNLADPEAGHMHRAMFTLVDSKHLNEEWVWKKDGKETKDHFELQRVK
jgi:hypothetical protein